MNVIAKQYDLTLNIKEIKPLKSSIQVNTFDSVELNVTIKDIDEYKDLTGCSFEIYGLRRNSNTPIEQLDGISVVDSIGGSLKIKLKEAFVSYADYIFVQICIKDLDEKIYVQPFVFYVTNNLSDNIVGEAFPDSISLDEFNNTVDDLKNLIDSVKLDESARDSNEEVRIINEIEREELFVNQVEYYNEVVSIENARQDAEDLRVDNENDRVQRDLNRDKLYGEVVELKTYLTNSEKERIDCENDRKSAEYTRVLQDDSRETNENFRKSNENLRVTRENDRKYVETQRILSENDRLSAEATRVSNEIVRKSNETTRVYNENQRVLEENRRNVAESNRQKTIDMLVAKISELENRISILENN